MAAFRVNYETLYENGSAEERSHVVYARQNAVIEGPLSKRQKSMIKATSFVPVWVVVDKTRHLSYYATSKRPENGDVPRKRIPLSELALIQHFDGVLELTIGNHVKGSGTTSYSLTLSAHANDQSKGLGTGRGSTITHKLDDWITFLRAPDERFEAMLAVSYDGGLETPRLDAEAPSSSETSPAGAVDEPALDVAAYEPAFAPSERIR